MQTREWMDEQEAAAWLDVPVEVIQEAILQSRLPALVIGRHIRISREALLALARNPSGPGTSHTTAHPDGAAMPSRGIPLPAGSAWSLDLAAAPTFEYQWPDGNRVMFDEVWKGVILLKNKPIEVRVGHIVADDAPDWLVIYLDNAPLCEFAETRDRQEFASLIKPDGRHMLPWGDPPPALYEGTSVQPYREATGFSGKGVPRGTAVVIAKDDMRSAVHHAVARWLGKSNLPIIAAA